MMTIGCKGPIYLCKGPIYLCKGHVKGTLITNYFVTTIGMEGTHFLISKHGYQDLSWVKAFCGLNKNWVRATRSMLNMWPYNTISHIQDKLFIFPKLTHKIETRSAKGHRLN